MFKLSFLIVFVLAGLCFGKEASTGAGGGDTGEVSGGGAPSGNADTSVADSTASGHQEDNEQNDEAAGEKEIRRIGSSLPDFIGDSNKRNEYVRKLLSTCSTQHQTHKINEQTINFENCTYTCIKLTRQQVNEETRIPSGMTCGDRGRICQENGPCPSTPVPSC
uniref:Putative secreted protein n=1 Tax=Ixodes scapularis TaxID=6945 RepID=Q4PN15_IXOSC|nr:putative secreted protein [Ixodes scapularis]